MDEHYQELLTGSAKIRGELQGVKKYWERRKNEKEKLYAREHRHLSDRLVQLDREQELSRQEFEELESLLSEMELLEQEATKVRELNNIIKRHDCIEMCRSRIEDILRRSRLRRNSEPLQLANMEADIRRTSAYELAMAKQMEKIRILRQYNPGKGVPDSKIDRSVLRQSPPDPASKQPSKVSSVSNEHSTSGVQTPHIDLEPAPVDEARMRRMVVSSSLFGQPLDHERTYNSGRGFHASPSTERAMVQNYRHAHGHGGVDLAERHRSSTFSLRTASDLRSLSKPSVTRHHIDDHLVQRRQLAMESLMNKINEYKAAQYSIHPKDLLNCSYLRLTPSNIAQLEQHCRDLGRDPGLHAHLTERQIVDHFDNLPQAHQPASTHPPPGPADSGFNSVLTSRHTFSSQRP